MKAAMSLRASVYSVPDTWRKGVEKDVLGWQMSNVGLLRESDTLTFSVSIPAGDSARPYVLRQLCSLPIIMNIYRHQPDSLVKDILQIPLCQRRTLHVFVRFDLLGDNHRLLVLYRCHLLLSQALLGRFVVSKIELCADQDDGDVGRMVLYFGVPL